VLLVGGPETILAVNAISFTVSGVFLAALRFGEAPVRDDQAVARPSLFREARDGLVATAGMTGLRLILATSGAALLFGAIFNVGQPLLVRDVLEGGDAGFAVLVTIYGLGFITGSLSGARGGDLPALKRRYLAGALLMALGFAASGLAPSVAAAGVAFLAAGYGNGLLLVYERLLIQAIVPDRLAGRVFGIRDAITAWAFASGFLVGPLLLSVVGTRPLIIAGGVCGLVVWLVSVWGLRRVWRREGEPELAGGAGAKFARDRGPGEHSADLVGR
jgi:MFS family permease